MDDHARDVFLSELKKQCEFCMAAAAQVNYSLERLRDRDNDAEQRKHFPSEVFRGLHSFLTHASNVSRILWPPVPSKRKKEKDSQYAKRLQKLPRVNRASVLKEFLEIEEDHILRQRTLRDHLEHYDERLDDWSANSERRNIVTDMIGDPAGIVGIDDRDRMRNFNPNGAEYIFRGERFNVQAIASAIESLLRKLNDHEVL